MTMHVVSSIAYLELLLLIEFLWRYGLDNLFLIMILYMFLVLLHTIM